MSKYITGTFELKGTLLCILAIFRSVNHIKSLSDNSEKRKWPHLCMGRIFFAATSLPDGRAHEQAIISSQLFADHVVSSRPMKGKQKMQQMIMLIGCLSPLAPKPILYLISFCFPSSAVSNTIKGVAVEMSKVTHELNDRLSLYIKT